MTRAITSLASALESLFAAIYCGLRPVAPRFIGGPSLGALCLLGAVCGMVLGGVGEAWGRVEFLWSHYYGGEPRETSSSITAYNGGMLLVGTVSTPGNGFSNILLLKLNNAGDSLWSRLYGGQVYNQAASHIIDASNNVVVAGTVSQRQGDYVIYKIDVNGDLVWSNAYGGNSGDNAYSLTETYDNGFAVVGVSFSQGRGGIDLWLIKVDGDGDLIWSNVFGGAGHEIPYSILELDDNGLLILMGSFYYRHIQAA
ncbi:MAG: hypothetical protein FJY67_07270 [Calditrichaeota bacterium]|nr:hypothetical protein [Calditrichota bacterium]